MSATPSAEHPRLLAIIDRSLSAGEIEGVCKSVRGKLLDEMNMPFEIVDSAKWYRASFAASGGWDSWIWETVTGKGYESREEHFRGFVVCQGENVSRATAGIVELALRNDRPVLFWDEEAPYLKVVAGVEETDPGDFSRGWKIYTRKG